MSLDEKYTPQPPSYLRPANCVFIKPTHPFGANASRHR
jgi:hypothetical protein